MPMLEAFKPLLPAVAGFLAFFCVLLAVIGMASPPKRDPSEELLVRVTQRGQPASLTELELQAPFVERFVRPFASQLSKIMARLTPAGALEGIQRQLMYAGYMGRMQVSDFMGIRGLSTVLGLALAIGLSLLTNQGTFGFFLFTLFFGGLGYILP